MPHENETPSAFASTTSPPRDKEELRRFVVENGCFALEENQRIFDKYFRDSPRYLFRAVDRRFGISRKRLCDVGCAYGVNLVHCVSGSYGVELKMRQNAFARSLSLNVFQRDFIRDDLSDLPKVDAVWSSGVLEHVDSPHIFLRKAHQLLNPNGLIVLHVPTVPRLRFLRLGKLPYFGRYFVGHTASDHINAFTPETLTFFCERAGFATLEVSPFFPGPLRLLNRFPPFPDLFDGTTYVGVAVSDWEYPERANRRVAKNADGFVRRSAAGGDVLGV